MSWLQVKQIQESWYDNQLTYKLQLNTLFSNQKSVTSGVFQDLWPLLLLELVKSTGGEVL